MKIDSTSVKKDLYERLYVSAGDFSLAKQYAEHLLKKGWHAAPYERRGTIYMQQSAFTTALIVSYARPFTKSKGWPKFPQEFIAYDESANQLHKKIMDLRHQVYAHSDSTNYSIRPFKVSDSIISDIIAEPFRRLTANECKLLVGMIDNIQVLLLPRLEQLRKELADETTARTSKD